MGGLVGGSPQQGVAEVAAADAEVTQPDRQPLQRRRERQPNRAVRLLQPRVECRLAQSLFRPDKRFEYPDHQIERRHDRVGVVAGEFQRPQVRPPAAQVQGVGLAAVGREARFEDVTLDEVHQVDKVRGRAEHRAALLAGAEVGTAKQLLVARQLLEIGRRRGQRAVLKGLGALLEGIHGEPRQGGLVGPPFCLELVSTGLFKGQPGVGFDLGRQTARQRRRRMVAAPQQLESVQGPRPDRLHPLIGLQVGDDHRARVVRQGSEVQLLKALAVRQVIDRQQVEFGVQVAHLINPGHALPNRLHRGRGVRSLVHHLAQPQSGMQVDEGPHLWVAPGPRPAGRWGRDDPPDRADHLGREGRHPVQERVGGKQFSDLPGELHRVGCSGEPGCRLDPGQRRFELGAVEGGQISGPSQLPAPQPGSARADERRHRRPAAFQQAVGREAQAQPMGVRGRDLLFIDQPGDQHVGDLRHRPGLEQQRAQHVITESHAGHGRVKGVALRVGQGPQARLEPAFELRRDDPVPDGLEGGRAERTDRLGAQLLPPGGYLLTEPAVEQRGGYGGRSERRGGAEINPGRPRSGHEHERRVEPVEVLTVDAGVARQEVQISYGQGTQRDVAAVVGLPGQERHDGLDMALEFGTCRVRVRKDEVDLPAVRSVVPERRSGQRQIGFAARRIHAHDQVGAAPAVCRGEVVAMEADLIATVLAGLSLAQGHQFAHVLIESAHQEPHRRSLITGQRDLPGDDILVGGRAVEGPQDIQQSVEHFRRAIVDQSAQSVAQPLLKLHDLHQSPGGGAEAGVRSLTVQSQREL